MKLFVDDTQNGYSQPGSIIGGGTGIRGGLIAAGAGGNGGGIPGRTDCWAMGIGIAIGTGAPKGDCIGGGAAMLCLSIRQSADVHKALAPYITVKVPDTDVHGRHIVDTRDQEKAFFTSLYTNASNDFNEVCIFATSNM